MERSENQPSKEGDNTPCCDDAAVEEAEPLVMEPMDVESLSVSSAASIKRRPFIQFLGIYITLILPVAVVGLSVLFLYNHDSRTSINKHNHDLPESDDEGDSEAKDLRLDSGVPRYDAAFALARREVAENIQNDGTFIAGHGWTQLWTRDTSYAVELSLALVYPTSSQKALEACTRNADVYNNDKNNDNDPIGFTWLQDECGHFQGWPYLSDAIVGAQGAWSLYLATGNADFLVWAHAMTQNTLRWAERDVYDSTTGLFRGCSSFMESNSGYPVEYKMNGPMVGQTKALSTNVLYYNGYKLAAGMQLRLQQLQQHKKINSTIINDIGSAHHKSIPELEEWAVNLAQSIQSHLWLEDQGYHAYFEDAEGIPVTQMEGLGESLLLLAPDLEQNQTRIQQIFDNTYRSPNGIPCLWPQFPNHKESTDTASYYHNGRIWPFVQGYWALAAARHGQVDIFAQEVDHLVHLALDNPQWKATFAEFYELNGDFVWDRRRQLWSGAGFLGMIIHGLFGVALELDGIRFQPVKPRQLSNTTINANGPMKLEHLTYREASLTIILSGFGSTIESFRINGTLQEEPVLSADIVGDQLIEISLREA